MMSAVGSPPNASKISLPVNPMPTKTTREDLLSSPVKKPPFESRKSAEELKLRLASAVSAKIANSKDGRNANRGIGFLLQRKEQQENRLNTKDISFQKPVRNGSSKVETDTTNATAKSVRNGMSKTELQKSLLSALMNSRTPSGVTSGQAKDRLTIGSKLNSSGTVKGKATAESNRKPLTTTPNVATSGQNKDTRLTSSSQLNPPTSTVMGKTINESNKKTLATTPNAAISGQNTGTLLTTGSKLIPSSSVKGKTSNESNKTPPPNVTTENELNKSQLDNVDGDFGSGKVLDKAKNIESLLGLRKQDNSSVRPGIAAAKDAALNGKGKITEREKGIAILNAEKNGDMKLNRTAVTKKPVGNGLKDGMAILNGKNNVDVSLGKFGSKTKPLEDPNKALGTVFNASLANSKLNKTARITQSVGNDRKALNNSTINGLRKTVPTSRPLEKVEKQSPPPVAKKPTRTVFQTASNQGTMPSGIDRQESVPKDKFGLYGQGLPGNETTRGTTKRSNSPQIQRKTPVLTTTKGNSPQIQRKAIASKVNGTNLGKETAFREDLLEKLEADVGSCKIAAFQSMEDFSVLRMKVYRVRGELDQLKRDREKRTPLLC